MSTCLSNCTLQGQHVTDCEDREECRGCLPRPAEIGQLCGWCWQRLRADVAGAPDLVQHLRVIGHPHAQVAPPSDGKSYKDPAESSILPAAWLAADEIHGALSSWALLVLDEHPNGPEMAGPESLGTWHTQYGAPVGIRDISATVRVTGWLAIQLEWCAGQQWAAVMREELAGLMATTSARWPTASMVERTRHISVPCPRCNMRSLTYAPPSFFKQPFKVSCSNPDCARVFSEDEWDRFKALALSKRPA